MTSAVQVFPPPWPHADEAQPPKPDTQFPAPLPTSFVITRMDPVGMVTNIGLDDEAIAAAEELAAQAQDYLVVLLDPLDRVCADSKWCRYTAYPVATTFRPPCPELGITPEMVLPIPPNPAVAPVRTLSRSDTDSHEEDRVEDFRFPFDDGYFWIFSSMVLRVRARRQDGGFDDTKAIKMPMSFEQRLMDLEAVLSDASFSTPSTLSFIPNFPQHPVPPDPFLYVDESAMATADQDLETKGEVVDDTCAAPEDLLQDSDWESFLEDLPSN
ncbi:hypothetical protein LXA43DRAFT_889658 [Ganoderma leucocontextum]|nr:hypothetical protein LXA43DRAFT_889658 [Ganoderma leucocontextum]